MDTEAEPGAQKAFLPPGGQEAMLVPVRLTAVWDPHVAITILRSCLHIWPGIDRGDACSCRNDFPGCLSD